MDGSLQRVAVAGYATVVAAVVCTPTLLLTQISDRGSLASSWAALDLLAVSGTVGVGCAVLAYRWLRRACCRPDGWIAALYALVVLAVLTSVLLGALLHQLGPAQAWLADRPVMLWLLWAAAHLPAAAAAEATRRMVLRWLAPARISTRPPAARPAIDPRHGPANKAGRRVAGTGDPTSR